MGTGTQKALLRQLRSRAPGGGDRRRDRHLARGTAQFSARLGVRVPEARHRPRGVDPGRAGLSDVHEPVALEHDTGAGAVEILQRTPGATAGATHARRGSADVGVSGCHGLSG